MNQTEIKRKRESIDSQLESLAEQVTELQSTCTHPNASHVNRADTGNWCRDDDQYWTEHHCTDCGKYWQTDQNWQRK